MESSSIAAEVPTTDLLRASNAIARKARHANVAPVFRDVLATMCPSVDQPVGRESVAGTFASIDAHLSRRQEHVLDRESTGTGLGDYIQPRCSCGWVGDKFPGYSNTQHSDCVRQETRHLTGGAL